MEIFGWIMLILLAMFGVGTLILFAAPFIITECKMFKQKIAKAIEDKKFDLDKRSEERKNRDTLKREKDFELANRKLDAKILKVDKQIKLQEKKLNLAKELKETTKIQKDILQKSVTTDNVQDVELVDAPSENIESESLNIQQDNIE